MVTDYIGNVKYRFHRVFLSGESVQAEVLYGTALEYAGVALERETVWDVCSGIGNDFPFSLRRKHKKSLRRGNRAAGN